MVDGGLKLRGACPTTCTSESFGSPWLGDGRRREGRVGIRLQVHVQVRPCPSARRAQRERRHQARVWRPRCAQERARARGSGERHGAMERRAPPLVGFR
eukprot:scaffold5890_cov110-Isochrysis_galbana.AAC.2